MIGVVKLSRLFQQATQVSFRSIFFFVYLSEVFDNMEYKENKNELTV